jgi:hypothetical protein
MKMGLDQAVLQGIENSDGKGIMTKEEVEKLLKHGAYDIFKEDQDGTSEKESTDFLAQDLDSILARRAKTVVHENTGTGSTAAGGTFSKASFKNIHSEGAVAAEVDVDDPDFWTKVVGEAKEEEVAELGQRKRQQQSYSEKEYLKRLDADGVAGSDVDDDASSSEYSDDSGDEDESNLDNKALRTSAKARKATKKKERVNWGGMLPVNERFRQSEVSYSYPAAAKTTGASAPDASFQGEGRKLGGGNDGADSTIFAIGSNDGMQDAMNSLRTLAMEREKRKKANAAAASTCGGGTTALVGKRSRNDDEDACKFQSKKSSGAQKSNGIIEIDLSDDDGEEKKEEEAIDNKKASGLHHDVIEIDLSDDDEEEKKEEEAIVNAKVRGSGDGDLVDLT